MASQEIVHEIISDILSIDPDLKNIKSELEKLVQELIANKPQTPFTKEFKDSLKAQIIGAINEQKILYEEQKDWNWTSVFHSLKFWMVGVSSLATCLLVFALFQYFDGIQQPNTQVTYIGEAKEKEITPLKNEILEMQPSMRSLTISEETQTRNLGGGASNSADNVMMLAMPEITEENAFAWSNPSEWYAAKSAIMPVEEITSADMAIAETATDEAAATTASSPTFCETSKQFLTINNLSDTSDVTTKTLVADNTIQKATKDFIYDNQIYQAIVDYTNNNITIKHIGTQDDSQKETELPNLNLFFKNNNFKIELEYFSPIIEETDSYIEYYFARHNQQEWITARIDKTTNIIFSIKNICIY